MNCQRFYHVNFELLRLSLGNGFTFDDIASLLCTFCPCFLNSDYVILDLTNIHHPAPLGVMVLI